MLRIEIPNGSILELAHLVLDYNGTLALDGDLLPEVAEKISRISTFLQVHVLTADTNGTVAAAMADLPCLLRIVAGSHQDEGKLAYVKGLEKEAVVAIGNGKNDRLMLQNAALGIGLIQREGASAETLLSADVICTDIRDAFDLLLNPARLKATLRN